MRASGISRGLATWIAGLILAAACGGGAGPVAATAGATTATFSPALQAIVDAAKKEGQLDLVWPGGILDGPNELTPQIAGYKKMYGLGDGFKVTFTPGPQMPDMAAKIVQEAQAKQKASTDVFLGTETHFIVLRAGNAVEKVNWTSFARNIKDPSIVAPDGIGVQVQSTVVAFTYNTNKIKGDMIPKTLQDLADPKYKGLVATTSYAAKLDRIASPQIWGEAKTLAWVTAFKKNVAGFINCGEEERVASGEFAIFAFDCGTFGATRLAAKGAPVAFSIPSDTPIITYYYEGVPVNAAHPNAAKLWVDYLTSREGQDLMYGTEIADHAKIPGSKSAADLKAFSSIKFTDVDIQFVDRDAAANVPSSRGKIIGILTAK